jgi:DNA-binding NtrC family response regulator
MLRRLISPIERLFRKVKHAGLEQRSVLTITRNQRYVTEMRVLAIQENWTVRFASTLAQAMERRPQVGPCVVIYDRELSRGDWVQAFRSLTHAENPVFCVLLADSPDGALRGMVAACGGYDVASMPFDRERISALIRGALALAAEIDGCRAMAIK